MDIFTWFVRYWRKAFRVLSSALLLLLSLYGFVRVFVCDRFVVDGVSMVPTYSTGKVVYVNKLLMGARIYKKYDFNLPSISSFRMPGFRKVRVGDVVVFNYSYDWSKNTIGFKINTVYLKRCVGCPGDTVQIIGGFYVRPSVNIIPDNVQVVLASMPDSLLALNGVAINAYEFAPLLHWTIKEFGPLYVPRAGDTIVVNASNSMLYESLIEYETGQKPKVVGDSVIHKGQVMHEYKFENNYYFFAGDNVMCSIDSRYFGLVPEEFIIGIIPQ